MKELLIMSDIVGTSSNKPLTVLETSYPTNCAQEQEVRDLLEISKLEYRKNIGYKVILDIVDDYIREDNNDNLALKQKINSIILGYRVSETLILNPNDQISLLGIQKVNKGSLSYSEGNILQEVIIAKLTQKRNNLQKQLDNTGEQSVNNHIEKRFHDVLKFSTEEKVLLDTKRQLIAEQELYVKNLLELQEVLLEISELRLKTLPEGVGLKIKHYELQDKINSIKTLFTEGKMRFDIFTETSCALEAYKELIKDIEKQQSIYQKEIEELEEMKEKYKQVSCKQFDEILNSYKQYKSSLEQKKKMYHFLST